MIKSITGGYLSLIDNGHASQFKLILDRLFDSHILEKNIFRPSLSLIKKMMISLSPTFEYHNGKSLNVIEIRAH